MSFSTLTDKRDMNTRERGFLDGQFLIAMPGMQDGNFARSVVYICAHSPAGAMGFVINRPQSISFTEILLHLKLVDQPEAIMLPGATRDFPILSGGPVETGRGFVLHSDDYASESSIPVSDDISMTATLDIVAPSATVADRAAQPCCSVTPAGAQDSWRTKSAPMAG